MAARLDSRKIKSLKRRRKGSHEDPSAVCSDGTTLVLDSMSETSCSSSLHQEQRSTMLSSRADADRLTSQQQLTHDRRTNGCRSPPLTSQVMATPAQSIYNLRSTSRMPQSKIFAYGPCQSDDHSSNGHREVVDFHVQDRNAKMSTMIITRERLLKPSPRHGRRSYNGSIASPIGGTPWSHRSSDSALGPSFLALESLQVSFERPSMLQPAAISHINEKRCHSQCGDEDDVEDDDDDDDDTNSYMEVSRQVLRYRSGYSSLNYRPIYRTVSQTSSSPSPLMHHQRFNSMPVGIATATDQTGSLAHQVCARTAPHLCHSTATVEREILFSSFSNCVPRCSVKRTLPKVGFRRSLT